MVGILRSGQAPGVTTIALMSGTDDYENRSQTIKYEVELHAHASPCLYHLSNRMGEGWIFTTINPRQPRILIQMIDETE